LKKTGLNKKEEEEEEEEERRLLEKGRRIGITTQEEGNLQEKKEVKAVK
jgi:hypothetical protein